MMKSVIARPQYQLTPDDLSVTLALARGGTLADFGGNYGDFLASRGQA